MTDREVYLLYLIAFATTIISIVFIALFFLLWNTPETHKINVVNNCGTSISATIISGDKSLKSTEIQPGSHYLFEVSPGFNGYLVGDMNCSQGCIGNSCTGSQCPYTQGFIHTGGDGGGNIFMKDSSGNTVQLPFIQPIQDDVYSVGMQNGFNLPMTIIPDTEIRSLKDPYYCSNVEWKSLPLLCPDELKIFNNGRQVACSSACSATHSSTYCCEGFNCEGTETCQSKWSNQSYYNVFHNSCPDCLITNCDSSNYSCTTVTNSSLTNYSVLFCPTVQ